MFEVERAKIKKEVSKSSSFALTRDIWTLRASHAYTGITIYYINEAFEMKHYLLETKEFLDSHSAASIADELRGILAEWDLLDDNMSAITTDNGRNLSAAAREHGWTNLPCFSQKLQLGVEKLLKLPQVMKAIARCKRIATHFQNSSKSSYILKEKQKSLGHKECVVIEEVSTCWNSSYYMVERILRQQQPLCATLLEIHNTDLMPTDSEFKTLEEFVTTMRPLVDITEAIGAEK